MSKQVSKRGSRQIQIGPDVRKVKGPLIAGGAAVLLIIDGLHWHLVHHLLGAGSGIVVLMMVIVLLGWGWLHSRRRKGE